MVFFVLFFKIEYLVKWDDKECDDISWVKAENINRDERFEKDHIEEFEKNKNYFDYPNSNFIKYPREICFKIEFIPIFIFRTRCRRNP